MAWTRLRAPRSLMDTIGDDAIGAAAAASPLQQTYGATVDRESAYEKLAAKVVPPVGTPAAQTPAVEPRRECAEQPEPEQAGTFRQVLGNTAVRSFLRSAASAAGREITRGMFGTRRRRR